VGLSFDTISSTGPNAAVIHYKPERGNCSVIDPKAIYLCDSGAQYLDGTTDTTRTLHFGEPTEMERKAYTLVLKGNIALEVAKFPKGVSGFALDTLARQFLWEEGLDYRHGTGHGVGSFLVSEKQIQSSLSFSFFFSFPFSFLFPFPLTKIVQQWLSQALNRMCMKVLSALAHGCSIRRFPCQSETFFRMVSAYEIGSDFPSLAPSAAASATRGI